MRDTDVVAHVQIFLRISLAKAYSGRGLVEQVTPNILSGLVVFLGYADTYLHRFVHIVLTYSNQRGLMSSHDLRNGRRGKRI